MAFRFLHTADWQMGMQAVGLRDAAEAVRQARLAAAARVVDAARVRDVECIVIAGDLFEDNGVEPLLVQRVADILQRAPCPVFVLPGNHDPLVAGTVYDREVWRRSTNVTIWRSAEPVALRPGVTFYPCPYLHRRVQEEATAWIPAREPGDQAIRVSVAHGALRGIVDAEDESAGPVDLDAAIRHDLDYLALGHWHSTFVHPETRVAYSGTHESTRFGERDSGNVLVVEIPGPGEPPRIEAVRTGGLTWRQEERGIASAAEFAALLRAFDAEDAERAKNTVLELRLTGVVAAAVVARVGEDLAPLLAARYLYARLVTDDLLMEPTEAELLTIAPAGPVRAACEHLLREAGEAADEHRRAIARHALSELFALSREVSA